jgi:hypothetical protein
MLVRILLMLLTKKGRTRKMKLEGNNILIIIVIGVVTLIIGGYIGVSQMIEESTELTNQKIVDEKAEKILYIQTWNQTESDCNEDENLKRNMDYDPEFYINIPLMRCMPFTNEEIIINQNERIIELLGDEN